MDWLTAALAALLVASMLVPLTSMEALILDLLSRPRKDPDQ